MGIPALWEAIKEQDRSIPIAQLAEEHYRRYGRPLRIAIDEADWRFNNLTTAQVFFIRQKSDQPAFQGIEKQMFHRICRLLTLNIQLLFVFDGPCRPWKRGKRGGNKVDYEKLRLLKEMLRHFRIPYHEAPGEAEAECARLQALGIVDAVFSQDSDSLMFGCDVLIRDDRVAKEKGNTDRSKENTKKSGNSVRIVRLQEIAQAHGLDREGLVLFAMLAGGDYGGDLRGCGPAKAIQAAKAGLGRTLCQCQTKRDCAEWRLSLVEFFQSRRPYIEVPVDWPDIKILTKYNRPNISTDEQLMDLRGLRKGWSQPFNELKLLELTSSRFNIWGKHYLNKIGPILLSRALGDTDPCSPRENPHAIKLVKTRAKKTTDGGERPLERKLSFSPFALTSLKEEQLTSVGWTNTESDLYEPNHRVESEIPNILLENALPLDLLNPPSDQTPKTRKRKQKANPSEEHEEAQQMPPKKKKRQSKATRTTNMSDSTLSPVAAAPHVPNSIAHSSPQQLSQPSLHKRSSKGPTSVSEPVTVSLLSDSDDSDGLDELVLNPATRYPPISSITSTPVSARRGVSTLMSPGNILDLGSEPEDLEEEEAQIDEATRASLQHSNGPTKHDGYDSIEGITSSRPERYSASLPMPIPKRFQQDVSGTNPVSKSCQHYHNGLQYKANETRPPESDSVDERTDAQYIRMARLRHFEERLAKAVSRTSSSPSSPMHQIRSPAQPFLSPSSKADKVALIECIDLTDD